MLFYLLHHFILGLFYAAIYPWELFKAFDF